MGWSHGPLRAYCALAYGMRHAIQYQDITDQTFPHIFFSGSLKGQTCDVAERIEVLLWIVTLLENKSEKH